MRSSPGQPAQQVFSQYFKVQGLESSFISLHRDPENQSDEAAEEEEVIRTDMVESMLEKVLNLLCNLVRSKRELAERVGFNLSLFIRVNYFNFKRIGGFSLSNFLCQTF